MSCPNCYHLGDRLYELERQINKQKTEIHNQGVTIALTEEMLTKSEVKIIKLRRQCDKYEKALEKLEKKLTKEVEPMKE